MRFAVKIKFIGFRIRIRMNKIELNYWNFEAIRFYFASWLIRSLPERKTNNKTEIYNSKTYRKMPVNKFWLKIKFANCWNVNETQRIPYLVNGHTNVYNVYELDV